MVAGLLRRFFGCGFLVLLDPRERGFDVGEFRRGKPFDSDAGRRRLLARKFRAGDSVHPYEAAAHFGREFLLLLVGHFIDSFITSFPCPARYTTPQRLAITRSSWVR